ncbi:hypothetical protein BH09VER1_BH09VER1_49670 [soil metagenome]
MSRHRHHRHDSHASGTPPHHVPYWQRAHTDWRFWLGIVVMFIAMVIYVMSGNLAGQPGLQPLPPTPGASAK